VVDRDTRPLATAEPLSYNRQMSVPCVDTSRHEDLSPTPAPAYPAHRSTIEQACQRHVPPVPLTGARIPLAAVQGLLASVFAPLPAPDVRNRGDVGGGATQKAIEKPGPPATVTCNMG
jgi:hypothetical protein